MKKKHNLNLLNEDIRLISDKDDAYVEAIGQYILSTINKFDAINTPFPMPYLKKALYGCVFLTDELFEKKNENSLLLKKIAELEAKLEEVKKTDAKLDAVRKSLNKGSLITPEELSELLDLDTEENKKNELPKKTENEAKPKSKKNTKK